jgi:hypothetical protein
MQMEIEVTIPVTVVVNYDADTPRIQMVKAADMYKAMMALRSSLERTTSDVVKDRILDLMDDAMVDSLTDATGWCINGARIQVTP